MDPPRETNADPADWLVGGGQLGERVRAFDWSKTPLGPIGAWPASLRVAVNLCLNSRFPMHVWWGPELTYLYNDAHVETLGGRHPSALGQPAPQVWPEVWSLLAPQVEAVMTRGESVWNQQVHVVIERNGFPEDCWFTWSYSPIRDEAGNIVGLYNVSIEDTPRVLAERERDRASDQRGRRRADEQARAILESISDAFFALDREWRFTYMNPQAERALDRRPGELIGKNIWDEYPGLKGTEFEGIYRRAAAERVAGSVTAYFPDHARWYEVHTYPAREGLSVYFRDVTGAKQSAAALRESRERMEVVVKGANVGVWYCLLPFDKLIWDEKVKEHFHLPPDAEVRIDTFYERIHPDDLERTKRAINASIERREPYDIDYRTVSPDGQRVKWIRANGRGFYDAAGNATRFDGITIDVTDRVLAEQRVSRLYSVAAALSEAVTPEDVARVAVRQGISAVGATAGSLALLTHDGTHMEMAGSVGYPPGAMDRWQRFALNAPIPLAEAAARGEPVYTESAEDRLARYPALAPVNALKETRSSACLPLITGGRVVGVLGLSFDRNDVFSPDEREFMLSLARQCAQALDRARLFEAERHARDEAERASRMKDEFLATLSHELRTPLNAILGWSQILSGGARDEEDLAEGLRTIERNAKAQTQIIEDLLDMSRIISGKVRLDVQRVDLAAVVTAAADTLKPTADAKGVRVQVLLDPLAAKVSGDPGRLQQVLWNLLSNAVKFTPRGGRVQVLLERVDSHLEVSVIDTGEGIKTDFLPYVFDRFRQADASSTRRHGGLGLGLAIVKQLVELHGGEARAKSPGPGLGSTFTVSFPLAAVHGETEPSRERRHPTAPGPQAPATARADLAGVRILVVDDEPDARELVRRLLEDCNAVVTVAASATEAIEHLRTGPPDVLVSDIGMPEVDGHELIRRVRALGTDRGGDTPAVALTAYARTEDRVKAVTAGFQHHVAKPVEPNELIAMIVSLARRAP